MLQVNEHILRAKSLKLDLEGAKEELTAARSALELAHKNHKEKIAKFASFYQKNAQCSMLAFSNTLTLTGVS